MSVTFEFRCPQASYRCNYGACIDKSRRCDGFEDCIDGSDEFHCDIPNTCTDREYQCFQSLECIPFSSICNGKFYFNYFP